MHGRTGQLAASCPLYLNSCAVSFSSLKKKSQVSNWFFFNGRRLFYLFFLERRGHFSIRVRVTEPAEERDREGQLATRATPRVNCVIVDT